MIDLNEVMAENEEDINGVMDWYNSVYNAVFAPHFSEMQSLYQKLKSASLPISDEDLERILTVLPMDMFSVSEALNSFRLQQEVIKLKNKRKEYDVAKVSDEPTAAKRSEAAAIAVLEGKLLNTAYTSIVTRVENEISFSRELIMSAKKLWDARRRTENANPVGEIDPDVMSNTSQDLPNYSQTMSGKSYIK